MNIEERIKLCDEILDIIYHQKMLSINGFLKCYTNYSEPDALVIFKHILTINRFSLKPSPDGKILYKTSSAGEFLGLYCGYATEMPIVINKGWYQEPEE